jgi:hypothetical protein
MASKKREKNRKYIKMPTKLTYQKKAQEKTMFSALKAKEDHPNFQRLKMNSICNKEPKQNCFSV